MRRAGLAFLFAGLFMLVQLSAHEGHAHKIMGTVSVLHENHLDVKGTDGKVSTVTLAEKTSIVRGTTALKASDIRPGDRVVVTATETKGPDGKTTMVASRVQVGARTLPGATK